MVIIAKMFQAMMLGNIYLKHKIPYKPLMREAIERAIFTMVSETKFGAVDIVFI